MNRVTVIAGLAVAFAGCASAKVECVNAKGWQINAEPSHADGVYAKGEDVSFDFLATEDGKPLANWDLELSVEKPGVALPEKTSVKTDAEGRYTLVVPAPAKPGWVCVNAMTQKPANAKGRRQPGGRFVVGAMCDKDAIRPGLPPPADFKAFWDAEIAKLAKVPMNPKLTPVALKENDAMKDLVDAWEFELGCVGPRPATGYLVKPKKAAPKSLPVFAFFQGASGKTVGVPSYYGDRAICVIANKFGIPNGLTPAEYEKPELKQEWNAFSQRGKTSRDEIFFKWMILRDLRILEFAKSQPEWNGKVVMLNGESLGGGQSLAVGALDKDVTFVCACVPALSDHNGALAGRRNGWPKLWKPGADGKPQTDDDRKVSEAARYVDTANFCSLYTPGKEVTIGTGWVDTTCPPEGVLAAFNAVPAGVTKNLWFNPKGGHGAGNKHGGKRILEMLGK